MWLGVGKRKEQNKPTADGFASNNHQHGTVAGENVESRPIGPEKKEGGKRKTSLAQRKR